MLMLLATSKNPSLPDRFYRKNVQMKIGLRLLSQVDFKHHIETMFVRVSTVAQMSVFLVFWFLILHVSALAFL